MKEKFRPAFNGILLGFKDPAIRLQMILAMLAMIAGFVLKLNIAEWIAVILCMGLVLSSEILNTCVEKVCDLYSKEEDERIKVIKDLAAGAVLVSAICALITAALILISRL
ncbi:MAG: diacylglycerol kinase family protein [Erysipelotrichaceae bacterium]|nr:diacylglycerol kinase family protein [Erysipelotrichaceae bacterium]